MKLVVTHIEKLDLPTYLEAHWSANEESTSPAPVLATYRVTLEAEGKRHDVLLEVRSEPRGGVLIDEYEEDGLFRAVMPLLANIPPGKRQRHFYNEAVCQLSASVAEYWSRDMPPPPWQYELRDREAPEPRARRDMDDRAREPGRSDPESP